MSERWNRLRQDAVDAAFALLPRRPPDPGAARACKIVAHRGEHGGNRLARENTLAAFARARDAGIWGIEADIRWTADFVPVICHDPDTARVFGPPVTIAAATFAELRRAVPDVPTLAELVETFAASTHLMLELKAERFPDIARQRAILADHLSGLAPRTGYHLLALDPALFDKFAVKPCEACIAVAQANMAEISERTLSAGLGGIAGHYLLLTERLKRRHEAAGQTVGTGFVRSRNALWREINRGVDWVFSNDAAAMQRVVEG